MNAELLVGNDNSIRVRGVKNNDTGSYMNACTTKTWALHTAADGGGSLVSSGTFDYVASSNGEYLSGIDDAVAIVAGTTYYLSVTLVESGVKFYINIPVVAVRRTGRTPNN